MHTHRLPLAASVIALALLVNAPLITANSVMQMNLAEMCARAHLIFRGTVVSSDSGTISVGGGQLPVVSYRLQVDELFRGDVQTVKGVRIAAIKTLGKASKPRQGNVQFFSNLPRMPEMSVGRSYLLLATRPSAVGLSTSVGLGQGLFRILADGKNELAVNDADNVGLFRDMAPPAAAAARTAAPQPPARGPVAYADLARQIRTIVQ